MFSDNVKLNPHLSARGWKILLDHTILIADSLRSWAETYDEPTEEHAKAFRAINRLADKVIKRKLLSVDNWDDLIFYLGSKFQCEEDFEGLTEHQIAGIKELISMGN